MKFVHESKVHAAFLLVLSLVSLNAQQNNLPTQPPRGPSNRVFLTATVLNKQGQAIGGLQQSNFAVFENKEELSISSFSGPDEPASVGILYDASGSMSAGSRSSYKQRSQITVNALADLLEYSNPANEYFVVGFNSLSRVPLDWTSDQQAVAATLRQIEPQGGTDLYDACYEGIQKLNEGRYSKRVIILISDGQDTFSRHSFKEVRELLRESGVLLYSMGVSYVAGSAMGGEGKGVLDALSSTSGGEAFFPKAGTGFKASEIVAMFQMLTKELRNQYRISFVPAPSVGKKKWHQIKVKVSPPTTATPEIKSLSVRTRDGYYQY